MRKVSLQFKNKRQLLLFVEYIGTPLCIIDFTKLMVICELSDEVIEKVTKTYQARVVEESL